MSKFTKLKNNEIRFSDISKDDEKAMMMERVCTYCGSKPMTVVLVVHLFSLHG
jgi:5-methylcytosine-specific restriction endonuclease McrA